MSYLARLHRWLSESPRHRLGVRIVQVAIALLMLFRVFTESPFALYLWGPAGIAHGSTTYVFGGTVGGWIDWLFSSGTGTFAVVATVGACAVLMLAGRLTRVATAIGLVAFWALEMRFPELSDGGDNVTRLVLFYMLFTIPTGRQVKPGSLAVWFHNVGVVAIGAQLIVIYLTAGFLKAFGASWTNGTAMYLVSQVEWFSLPATRWLLANPVITTAICYGTVAFQVWFPIAVFTRFRLLWLAAGVSLHLGIAVVMGLITFSTIMCSLELFMITDAEWARARAHARTLRARAALHPRLVHTRLGAWLRAEDRAGESAAASAAAELESIGCAVSVATAGKE
jgi:hypothetical protein